jgi:hypothetical protein
MASQDNFQTMISLMMKLNENKLDKSVFRTARLASHSDQNRCRRNPLDRGDGVSILHMAKFNAYQRRQILIHFSFQTLSH